MSLSPDAALVKCSTPRCLTRSRLAPRRPALAASLPSPDVDYYWVANKGKKKKKKTKKERKRNEKREEGEKEKEMKKEK
jgi:hypothetical protein